MLGQYRWDWVAIQICLPSAAGTEKTISLHTADRLHQFEVAMAQLPPRIRVTKAAGVDSPVNAFWADSIVRPLVADNLARGSPWYLNFIKLMRDSDQNNRTYRQLLNFESQGLQSMSDDTSLSRTDEIDFIRTVHRAMHMRMGRIYTEVMGPDSSKAGQKPTQGVFNRWDRFKEGIRLSLVNAKTEGQTRHAVTELLARAGQPRELRDDATMRRVQALLFGKDWDRVRDLALFALASYKRPVDEPVLPGETEAE